MAEKWVGDASSVTMNKLSEALSTNLRRHAKSFASISELCRACGVNRQQFNKYLSGETLPSLLNLAKIAAVLGVEVDDLITPPSASARKRGDPAAMFRTATGGDGLEIRTGYYLDYTTSSLFGDSMMITLTRISRSDSGYAFRAKLRYPSRIFGRGRVINYSGRAFSSSSAVYVNYVNEADPFDVVYCIMQPDMRYSADMIGVRSEMSCSSPQVPIACAFYLRYLGEKTDLRAAFRQCGVVPLDSLDETQSRIFERLTSKTQILRNLMRISDV